jgi:GT2 family glycosyltransferase
VGDRTLLAILVYGGAEFVPACLESAARLPGLGRSVDVLVLDDCSPDEAWSLEVRDRCGELGIGYYRSPRNIGIPRNMNLALLRGRHSGYDHVLIANSDLVFPANVVPALVRTAAQDERIASATAWSNHVSAFSLLNEDPSKNIGTQPSIDRVSSLLEQHFRDRAVDLPVGVGFCMLVPVGMVKRVGLLDPVFGRGYCEEVDWCLRARSFGLRNVLAPSAFVFHEGNATTRLHGILQKTHTSVPSNDAIIDLRYPDYQENLRAYGRSGVLQALQAEGGRVLVTAGAREEGYVVEVSAIDATADEGPGPARFVVAPSGSFSALRGSHAGFEAEFELDDADVFVTLRRLVGAPPRRVVVRDRGWRSDHIVERARDEGVEVVDAYSYPQLVAPGSLPAV